jgi:flagellin
MSYATGTAPLGLALGDLDGDGVLDVVNTDFTSNALGVHLGNGDGTFQARTSYSTGSAPREIALGDLDGDRVLDIVNSDEVSNTLSVHLANTTTTTTTTAVEPIAGISVATRTAALAAQGAIDGHLQTLNTLAGLIGAAQSRLAVAAETLRISSENFRAAGSRIVDADFAEESANLVRNRILQQAGAAVLTQANQLPELALRLLAEG